MRVTLVLLFSALILTACELDSQDNALSRSIASFISSSSGDGGLSGSRDQSRRAPDPRDRERETGSDGNSGPRETSSATSRNGQDATATDSNRPEQTASSGSSAAASTLGLGPNVDAAFRDLSGQNLANGNYVGADFTGADLSNANLSNANFAGASLKGALMNNANIRGANFTDADLRYATGLTQAGLDTACGGGARLSDSLRLRPC